MSEYLTTAAEELPAGSRITLLVKGVPTPARVRSEREGGMVAIEYPGMDIAVLYRPDHPMLVVPGPPPVEPPAPPVDPRDAVIDAARALVTSWRVDYSSGTAMAAAIGRREGELDAALARLDALLADRVEVPEQTRATCEAGWAGCGRDGTPSPLICPTCGHCSIHDHGGCAARTDTGRCGCTGGGA